MDYSVFNLPDFLSRGQHTDTYLHFYKAGKSSIRNKVVFSQNLICILLEGSKEIFNQVSHAKIDPGKLFLLAAGSALMSDGVATNGRYESILIFFSNDFLMDFCLRHHIQTPQKKEDPALITLNKDSFLFNYEKSLKLLEEARAEQTLQKIKIEELLLYLLQKYPSQIKSFITQAFQSNQENKIKQVVSANIEKGLAIDELAFLCNMSVSTFKRHFSEVFQTSPKKYFIQHKMERAKKLLQLNKRTSDIYFELGYSNLSSFSSEFKKHFGVSPKQFHAEIEPKAKVFESLA
ncbi:MAG TPA: AraC family transcriptional regulator [Chitinophagaceae bacterium]|nr:AraC family transcriptional regulator [Chitinophagaceae bacterium]